MVSVIIPTRGTGSFAKLLNLLNSLEKQTLQPQEVLIIIDFDVPRRPLEEVLKSRKAEKPKNLDIRIVCQDGYGVSAARNWGVKQAVSDYVLLCDDDIVLHEKDILERMYEEYHFKAKGESTILYPTITFHDTGHIQTQGFTAYNWLMCWPVPKYGVDRKSRLWARLPDRLVNVFGGRGKGDELQLLGSICVFAAIQVFKNHPYDERFTFIYEDLDRSYGAYKTGVKLYNSEDVSIQHWESEKDLLAWSYIDTPEHVYRKTKHRIQFILKHAEFSQRLLFYLIGFWLSNGWTLFYILCYGRRKNKLIKARWKGIKEGLEVLS